MSKLPFFKERQLVKLLVKRNLFSGCVKDALKQAKISHKNQTRHTGNSYLEEHIYPIVKDLVEYYSQHLHQAVPEKIVVSALLHDALEDDPKFTEKECQKGYTKEILDIIKPLTKRQVTKTGSNHKRQENLYQRNKKLLESMKQASQYSKLIKLADRYNNISCLEVIKGTPKYERYIRETQELFLPFAKKFNQYYYQKIKDKLGELKKFD